MTTRHPFAGTVTTPSFNAVPACLCKQNPANLKEPRLAAEGTSAWPDLRRPRLPWLIPDHYQKNPVPTSTSVAMARAPLCTCAAANVAPTLPSRRVWAGCPSRRPRVHLYAAGGQPQQQVQEVEQPQPVQLIQANTKQQVVTVQAQQQVMPAQAEAQQQAVVVQAKAQEQVSAMQATGEAATAPVTVAKLSVQQAQVQAEQQPQPAQVKAVQQLQATPALAQGSKPSGDKEWKDMTHKERQQMLALFTPKRDVKPFVQLDHVKRRREREMADIVQAAKKHGLPQKQVEENVAKLESLLPDLAPNLDKMKASDWVLLIKDPDHVAVKLITLKSFYPTANLSKIISRNPKVLLQDAKNMQADAKQVRSMLGEKLGDALDAIVEECPDLMRPAQAALSINNLKRWFPKQDPFEILKKNPSLLNNIEEADLKPDPTYGWESNYGWLATLDYS